MKFSERCHGICRSNQSHKITARWHTETGPDHFRGLAPGSRHSMPITSHHFRGLDLGLGMQCRPLLAACTQVRHNSTGDNDRFRSIPPCFPLFFANTSALSPTLLSSSKTHQDDMPRTKQTAKKSTGGIAKRRLLEPATRTLRSAKSSRNRSVRQSPQPAADVEMGVEPSASEYFHWLVFTLMPQILQVLPHRPMQAVLRLVEFPTMWVFHLQLL